MNDERRLEGMENATGAGAVDLVTQACKALCERSPYDAVVDDDGLGCNLPAGLAILLRQSVGRRKRRKSHLGSEGKGKGKGSIWVETEEYFRDLTLGDVEELGLFGSTRILIESKSFLIPKLGILRGEESVCVENENSNTDVSVVEEVVGTDGKAIKVGGKNEVIIDQESRNSDSSSLLDPAEGLDWILRFRNKDYLTTERPTRKRKRLGTDAGLQKVLIPCPCQGNETICDYCCTGDVWGESNPLITCTSCNVAVHRKCYGAPLEASDGSWMCSWCMQMSGDKEPEMPCILCSKHGGVLKPVHKTEEGGPVEFAHLFCTQWIPEVYVGDSMKLEPIMNVSGIKDVRRKLICNICKVKHGACVRCSHGSCRTSFHPICAREAGQRMEIWGKYGCDDVELRAFCSKHSVVQNGSAAAGRNNSVASHSDSPSTTDIPVTSDVEVVNQVMNIVDLENRSSVNGSVDDSSNLATILRNLIDHGKVTIEDVASEIAITPESLALALAQDGNWNDELQSKLFQWFDSHAYRGISQRILSVKLEPENSSKVDSRVDERGEAILTEPDALNEISVPARLRTKGKIAILQERKPSCPSAEDPGYNWMKRIRINGDQPVNGARSILAEKTLQDGATENAVEDEKVRNSSQYGGKPEAPTVSSLRGCPSQRIYLPDENISVGQNVRNPSWSDTANRVVNDLMNMEAISGYYVHPYIHKLWHMRNGFLSGTKEVKPSPLNTVTTDGFCCNHQNRHSSCIDKSDLVTRTGLDQYVTDGEVGLTELSPGDELEGEIIYLQHKLLDNAIATKQSTDYLVSEVSKRLSHEVESARRQGWDSVVVNQYLCELREATKRGRKERKHKEAQAALASTYTAAAVSSRPSALRKDSLEESVNRENLMKLNTSGLRAGLSSQLMPWAKETLTRVAAPRISLERHTGFAQSISNYSREPKSCDICERSNMNDVVVCSGCKVSVHLNCYDSIQEPTGSWYCELCEEFTSSKSFSNSAVSTGKQFAVECCLCGGTGGAFRKTTKGHWVHVFCTEWISDSKLKWDQVNSLVEKGVELCSICRQKLGRCVKCDYSYCQTSFHPMCARRAGFDVKLKAISGKGQRKAYCEKHSFHQRAKAENQKHEFEELRNVRQLRVELERLRLLCERIVRREKIKHEIVSCTNEILASKRDCVRYSLLMNHPYFRNDSSESATTSLRGCADDYKSSDEIFQKSDDATVDSPVSIRHKVVDHGSMDADQRTDDSSTTQQISLSGIFPCRHQNIASSNNLEYKERSSHAMSTFQHTGTLGREPNMTSDQRHIYVPEDSLSKR